MNILTVGKKSAQLCISTLMMSILLLPVQAAEIVPVPMIKPVMIDGKSVPLPTFKPDYIKESPDRQISSIEFKSVNLKINSQLSTEKLLNKYSYKPLSGAQAKLYSRIFKAQALGDMASADDLLAQISDKRLLGAVLYQRYTHVSYKSSFDELHRWMNLYADHFGADKIYKLAISRRGADDIAEITKPRNGRILSQVHEPTIYYPKHYNSKIKRSYEQDKAVRALSRKVRAMVRMGKSLEALKYFRDADAREFMDIVESDTLQAKIAAGFLYSKHFDSAYKLAAQSADRSGLYVPDAAWIAGLALWQKDEFAKAGVYFDKAGSSAYASGWLASAGSYWAARSYSRTGNQEKLRAALNNAAKHSRTFYGLMATQLLGAKFDFNWETPEYNTANEALILQNPAGERAFSLVAAGQYDLAEAELMRFDYKGNAPLRLAVLAYAAHVGLPGVALRLGNMVSRSKGKYYDSALYPISPWSPKDGYRLDPALIHAVVRQESRFNLQATSYSGAVGLMQIMPRTAQYVAKTNGYKEELSKYKLRLPEVNMKVGQDYLEYLLKGRNVKGDVVSLLVSYNAGPGNLSKWRKRMENSDDTLLFIEMMPVQETRDYVERVLSNYWIYRLRAGMELPSLAALANGKTPRYAHIMQAEYPYELAAN